MADEKRQLILDLLARAKTRQGTDEAAHDLENLGKAAEDADKKTERLGNTSEKTGHQTDKMGNSLDETKGRISKLDKEIQGVEKEISGLSAAFADADDAASRLDLGKALRKNQADLRSLKKNKGILSDLLPDEGEVDKELKKIEPKVSGLFANLGDSIMPALITAGVASAPAIGAILSGAVVGGAGIGGIVGGFLIASKDPRVQSAAKQMKERVGAELKDAAQPFVPVAIDALGKVRRVIENLPLSQIFKDAAAQSGPLIDGVVDLVGKLGHAVADLIHNSAPEVKAIGHGLSEIGTALGKGLESLADDGPAASDALTNLFTVVSLGITAVFGLIDGLTKVYEIGRKFGGPGLIDNFRDLDAATTPIAGKLKDMTENAIAAATGTNDLAKAQDADRRAAEGQRDALSDVAKELRAQTDPAFAVLDAMDKVRDAQKEAADSAHKYGENSEQARSASRKLAEAAIDLQGDVGALGSSFDGSLTPTMKRTLKAAGLTKAQIKEVETELRRAKKAADAYDGTYVAEIITNYTYNVGGADYNREANRGSFSKRAAGGPIVRGKPYIVGENGPEVVVPDASGRVLNASGSRGLMVQGAMTGLGSTGSGGGSVRQVELVVSGGDQRLVSLLKYLIRTANLIEATP